MDPPRLLPLNETHLRIPILQETFLDWQSKDLNSPRIFSKAFDQYLAQLQEILKLEKTLIEDLPLWIQKSTGVANKDISINEALGLWLRVIWYQCQNRSEVALECLRIFSESHDPPLNQHNPLLFNSKDYEPHVDTNISEPHNNVSIFHIPQDELAPLSIPVDFSARSHLEWNAALNTPDACLAICKEWAQDFASFFGIETEMSESFIIHAVDALRKMRAVKPSIYRSVTWDSAVRNSGLSRIVGIICQPDTDLERRSELIAQSYRQYCWKDALGEVFSRWMLSALDPVNRSERILQVCFVSLLQISTDIDTQTPYACGCKPSQIHDTFSIARFIEVLSSDGCLIPTASNPSTTFFLVSQDNFIINWKLWLLSSLVKHGLHACLWDPCQLHRELRRIKCSNYPEMHPLITLILTETDRLVSKNKEVRQHMYRPKLRAPLSQNLKIQDSFKKAQKSHKSSILNYPSTFNTADDLPNPSSSSQNDSRANTNISNSCIYCKDLPSQDRCMRTILVNERSDFTTLKDTVLTSAEDPQDRLPLHPKRKHQDRSNKVIYHTPRELGLERIAHRPEILKRGCQRDIVLLLNSEDTSQLVGAVQFNAIPPKTLSRLKQHHRNISTLPPLNRGYSFDAWRYGMMRAIGSRVPQGGRPGDTYTLYAGMEGRNEQEIRMLFGHAENADALVTIAQSIHPHYTRDVGRASPADTSNLGMNRLGTTSNNIFACSNYMSPQHFDDDEDISICAQYKKSCHSDEFNFAFTQWNCFIETIEGAVWLFHGKHLHGTIMPRLSSWQSWQVAAQGAARMAPLPQAHQRLRDNRQDHDHNHDDVNNEEAPIINHDYNLRPRDAQGRVIIVSGGDHITRRRRDAQRGRRLHEIRQQYDERRQYWNN
ncbi:hypothetical protein H0H93_003675 [Arthromyces matolae]|nr:hypothetical protein H0H93_003675 [Arthromyces matolae]